MNTKTALISALILVAGCASAPVATAPAAPTGATSRGAPVCMPIQRGVNGAVADTRIVERWPGETYGAQPVAFAGSVGNAARYVLVDFDLRAIPTGAVITRATITMHAATCASSAEAVVTAHRITTAWNEGTATWASFGSAFDPYVEAALHHAEGTDGPSVFDVTRLVRAWQSGEQAQHGVLLKQEVSSTAFSTSEAPSPSQRPRLDVCYTVPDHAG